MYEKITNKIDVRYRNIVYYQPVYSGNAGNISLFLYIFYVFRTNVCMRNMEAKMVLIDDKCEPMTRIQRSPSSGPNALYIVFGMQLNHYEVPPNTNLFHARIHQ